MNKYEFYHRLSNLTSTFQATCLVNEYEQPHRHYHTIEHLLYMCTEAERINWLDDELFLAIAYHDYVYDPKSKTNEEDSVIEFLRDFKTGTKKPEFIHDVEQAILATKTHVLTGHKLSDKLILLDLHELKQASLLEFQAIEQKIFKEYQFVQLNIYIEERCKVLKQLKIDEDSGFMDYVRNRKYNIAIYPGSFDPFHKGHQDILSKAEKLFDKVIIARGKNSKKSEFIYDLPSGLNFHETVNYEGLLTDYLISLNYPVTVIRGLRNGNDFENEKILNRHLEDLMPDIKIVYLMSDRNTEHISSTSIKELGVTKSKEVGYYKP